MNYLVRTNGNFVQCGYLDNIRFDFKNGKLPIDEINDNQLGMFDGLTWKEESDIKLYYNLACKQGANGVYHLKLFYVVDAIIKKYIRTAKWFNR